MQDMLTGKPRKLRRMRTINQVVEELKTIDPTTAITYSFINTLIKENKIRYIAVGTKRLVDLDSLIEYLTA